MCFLSAAGPVIMSIEEKMEADGRSIYVGNVWAIILTPTAGVMHFVAFCNVFGGMLDVRNGSDLILSLAGGLWCDGRGVGGALPRMWVCKQSHHLV